MDIKVTKLQNNIDFIYKNNKNTPRAALILNISLPDINAPAGVYSLMVRLFMQGTKNRTAQQLSEELDKYAIDFTAELKPDYLKLKFVCLNEDFEKAVEIFTDIVENTTFEEFEKEREKYRGEIIADLDSPRTKVIDRFYRSIYEGHGYGHTGTVVLENLDNISKNDIISAFSNIMKNSRKVISFAGDLDFDFVNKLVQDNLGNIEQSLQTLPNLPKPQLSQEKYEEIIQDNLNQAHILKGWLIDSMEDYAQLSILNIILGASGLSSRLFLELRDKKGLAYVVRSAYDCARLASNFSIYIATEPKNIEVSLKGFEEEIEKIKTTLVSEEELENAKQNLFGKWAFVSETNSQQAQWTAHYEILGLGYDYRERISEKIKKITAEDIRSCANKHFNNKFVLTVLKP